jgi:toxin-antitoxin system PIN domain toxin
VILPDVNLLIYAFNRNASHHAAARAWWENLMNGSEPVALPWTVSLGFVRLMTARRMTTAPMSPGHAVAVVRGWLARPVVEIIEPGPQHLTILDRLLTEAGVAGPLTTDAHLAALAIEHQCELHSHDTDFARFSGLRWRDPLAGTAPRTGERRARYRAGTGRPRRSVAR